MLAELVLMVARLLAMQEVSVQIRYTALEEYKGGPDDSALRDGRLTTPRLLIQEECHVDTS